MVFLELLSPDVAGVKTLKGDAFPKRKIQSALFRALQRSAKKENDNFLITSGIDFPQARREATARVCLPCRAYAEPQ